MALVQKNPMSNPVSRSWFLFVSKIRKKRAEGACLVSAHLTLAVSISHIPHTIFLLSQILVDGKRAPHMLIDIVGAKISLHE